MLDYGQAKKRHILMPHRRYTRYFLVAYYNEVGYSKLTDSNKTRMSGRRTGVLPSASLKNKLPQFTFLIDFT